MLKSRPVVAFAATANRARAKAFYGGTLGPGHLLAELAPR